MFQIPSVRINEGRFCDTPTKNIVETGRAVWYNTAMADIGEGEAMPSNEKEYNGILSDQLTLLY